ncbi:MAG: hypothetical protein AAF850_03670 [Pseudomonadota bacterium]
MQTGIDRAIFLTYKREMNSTVNEAAEYKKLYQVTGSRRITAGKVSDITGVDAERFRDRRRRGFINQYGELADNGRWLYSPAEVAAFLATEVCHIFRQDLEMSLVSNWVAGTHLVAQWFFPECAHYDLLVTSLLNGVENFPEERSSWESKVYLNYQDFLRHNPIDESVFRTCVNIGMLADVTKKANPTGVTKLGFLLGDE